MIAAIADSRLGNQRITRAGLRRAADVVRWLGAVQAQEYAAARWGIALRMQQGTLDSQIQRAFDDGRILRTHVMRPTWHFVTPADIRWLLELTAPRVHRLMASYNRKLELDGPTLARGTGVIERALGDEGCLTRKELGERLKAHGLAMSGQRLAHMALHAELEAVICSGPLRGKQFTYALVAERAPGAERLPRDEALATLARRFFRSHGPATIRDFVWWSGLTTKDARRGLDMIKARRHEVEERSYWTLPAASGRPARERLAHLLPIYDEYLVAYRDRHAVPHAPAAASSAGGAVVFQHALVIAGQVAGTWRAARQGPGVLVRVTALRPLSGREQRAVAEAAGHYGQFLSAPVELSLG
jgi:hypothetical protein